MFTLFEHGNMIRLGLQIYGGRGSLSHIQNMAHHFPGSGPNRPIRFSCDKISLK